MFKLNQASTLFHTYILISQIAHDVMVVARVADKLPLEEGDVDDGSVEIDALKDEHLEGEIVIEVGLRAVHLWKYQI